MYVGNSNVEKYIRVPCPSHDFFHLATNSIIYPVFRRECTFQTKVKTQIKTRLHVVSCLLVRDNIFRILMVFLWMCRTVFRSFVCTNRTLRVECPTNRLTFKISRLRRGHPRLIVSIVYRFNRRSVRRAKVRIPFKSTSKRRRKSRVGIFFLMFCCARTYILFYIIRHYTYTAISIKKKKNILTTAKIDIKKYNRPKNSINKK